MVAEDREGRGSSIGRSARKRDTVRVRQSLRYGLGVGPETPTPTHSVTVASGRPCWLAGRESG
jgi:hypothetical protein